jgi:hypothetical protein
MSNAILMRFYSLIFIIMLFVSLQSCKEKTPAEKLKEKMEETSEKAGDAVEEAEPKAEKKSKKAKKKITNFLNN